MSHSPISLFQNDFRPTSGDTYIRDTHFGTHIVLINCFIILYESHCFFIFGESSNCNSWNNQELIQFWVQNIAISQTVSPCTSRNWYWRTQTFSFSREKIIVSEDIWFMFKILSVRWANQWDISILFEGFWCRDSRLCGYSIYTNRTHSKEHTPSLHSQIWYQWGS